MSTSPHSVLGIGFAVQDDVLDKQRELAPTKNLDLTFCVVGALNEPPETALAGLKQKLEEHKYAIVSIGFGIRGNRDLTPLFERMVNLIIEKQPGVKLAFAKSPHDVVDACMRILNQE